MMVSSSRPFLFLSTLFFLFFYARSSIAVDLASATTVSSGQNSYACSPDSPCVNGACCGADGWCGYSPTYCGSGCQSNCNATAECGQYAAKPYSECPLNVCCSQYGFCGTTSDFCNDGCQSHCTQPKPAVSESNVQKRIVGYWEAWNSQHACGTMGVGQIPVNLLTHLNIAFAYINNNYQVTNMNGLGSNIYKIVGDLKARNPSLKIMIAIGGWTFNDPGTSQSVFPTMVSSQANRAQFIENLLGFLSEYGYDGVDFDWEYPGADDRGGSAADGVNYTALLQELRAAIQASGKDYLVTFTAPTSYWYLRHFDLKSMTSYVDWINLMAYDLHGVWDSSDPIGSHVLAHTNLTEIDLALDLFWRVNVEPSAIVLGLGFYGRSFQLSDSSCWKPGCDFKGPGAKGKCTNTAGILSYREIQDIITNAGGQAYLDEEAAVRYMVYGGDNWISFDDAGTFKSKINYANKMGLSGLMVWAIDLDDNYLNALRSISDPMYLNNSLEVSFDLVNLEYIFPPNLLPSIGTVPSYGITTFGAAADAGNMNPGGSGFGFLLIASDSHVVSRLRKREGAPDPFVFLDCPAIDSGALDTTYAARVVCFSDDLAGCFQVTERGVEGTIVEMPDNCSPNTFARAVSLKRSPDQSLPARIKKRNPTSKVFDFEFDFNLALMRRDSNNTSIRTDFSNVEGYWDYLVNSPGDAGTANTTSKRDLVERYWSPESANWKNRYHESGDEMSDSLGSPIKIHEDLSAPVFWDTITDCSVAGQKYGEGIGAFVEGTLDAEMYFGWSMVITTQFYGDFEIQEANGFLTIDGTTDLTYGIGGMGTADITKYNKGNPANSDEQVITLPGSSVTGGQTGAFLTFNPYLKISYQMATLNTTSEEQFSTNAEVSFNGLLTTNVLTDLGNVTAYYPSPSQDQITADFKGRANNKISTGPHNVVYDAPGAGGRIAVGTYLHFGMDIRMSMPFSNMQGSTTNITRGGEVGMAYANLVEFGFYPGDPADITVPPCSDYNVTTYIYQSVLDGSLMQWDKSQVTLGFDGQSPTDGQVCYPGHGSSSSSSKRGLGHEEKAEIYPAESYGNISTSNNESHIHFLSERGSIGVMPMPWDISPGGGTVGANSYYGSLSDNPSGMMEKSLSKLGCKVCTNCINEDRENDGICCGCACMDLLGYYDIPSCDECDPLPPGSWPSYEFIGSIGSLKRDVAVIQTSDHEMTPRAEHGSHQLDRRVYGEATLMYKRVTVCGRPLQAGGDGRYPGFPMAASWPWDGIEGGQWDTISRYWGNSSADCTNWGVAKLAAADTVSVNGVNTRAQYQTEHVLEGQLIGDFFNSWLAQGKTSQFTSSAISTSKLSCQESLGLFANVYPGTPWNYNGNPVTFIELLLRELGSIDHLDRMTIFMGRANLRKGVMFAGKSAVSMTTFATLTNDQQILAAKELGMVFNYMNDDEVWGKFCDTYEAIWSLLGDYENYYWSTPNAPLPRIQYDLDLQDEWEAFIRASLQQIVLNGQTTFRSMQYARRSWLNVDWTSKWFNLYLFNRQQIRLNKGCPNLAI